MKQEASKQVKRDAVATREKLLDAAVEVFSADGPRGARVDEICQLAGVNKRMVYHYFGDKDGLYGAALGRVYDGFYAVEVDLSAMLLPADELLEVLVSRYYKFLGENPAFVRLISYENLNDGRVIKGLRVKGKKAQVIEALRLALDKGQDAGEFRAEIDAAELLVSIFALCFFYFSNQHTMGELLGAKAMTKVGQKARVRHVVDLLLNGLRKK
ncbi:TetR/AcrR family transcriptional regulator [Poriferisphaera corsica]|nr:TetR/AcrR family transcriptional regulator [Poriferisphaera corsica]